MSTTTTTTASGDLAAIMRARRERRARDLRDLAARSTLDRMANRYGEDAAADAALAAAESAADLAALARSTGADLAAMAWERARSTAGTARRSDLNREARERHYATGVPVAVESRSDLAARVAEQHGDESGERAECWTVRVLPADESGDLATRRARLAEMLAIVDGAPIGWTSTAGAVAGALAADGPAVRPDHDAASCARPGCRKCVSARSSRPTSPRLPASLATMPPASEAGPLARRARPDARRNYRRPGRDLAAPKEQTTARAVHVIRETSLAAMLDRTRAMGAKTRPASDATASTATSTRPTGALDLATLATVTTAGRRGVAVDWHGMALATGMRADALAQWRRTVCGWVAADLPADEMPRLARAAGMSAADLAAAASDARADASGATARLRGALAWERGERSADLAARRDAMRASGERAARGLLDLARHGERIAIVRAASESATATGSDAADLRAAWGWTSPLAAALRAAR